MWICQLVSSWGGTLNKRILWGVGAVLMACCLSLPLVACKGKQDKQADTSSVESSTDDASKKTIYTTFFPVYDLTKRIVGDKMNVKMIIKGNQEPHDFELKAKDMAAMSKADLFVYNGAGMEAFIPDLKKTVGDDSKFLDLSQGLELLEHTSKPVGDSLQDAESSNEYEVVKDTTKDTQESKHGNVNPHTWLSIKNAMEELDTIYQKLATMDPDNAQYYKDNYAKSLAEFKQLDKKFSDTLSSVAPDKRYFVASHAAFNYLARDYGLKQVAVTGISPEDEPTAAQLATISDFVKKHNITTIFFEGSATPKVAETLARTTGAKTSSLYTMESLTDDEVKMGYLALMEKNLDALMESFSE